MKLPKKKIKLDKNKEAIFKHLLKGAYRFSYLMATDKRFSSWIKALHDKYGSPELPINNWIEDSIKSFGLGSVILKEADNLYRRLSPAEQGDLTKDINALLVAYSLGQEWEDTIVVLLLTGKLCPPLYNFYINFEAGRRFAKRLVLVLNPDTSIEDLRVGWEQISLFQKAIQKTFWPNYKKHNLTKKSFKQLGLAIETTNFRTNLTEEEMFKNLSRYEEMLVKKNLVGQTMSMFKLEGKKVKHLIPKSKRTYKEAAKKLLHKHKKVDVKKATDLLRKINQRFKQKA